MKSKHTAPPASPSGGSSDEKHNSGSQAPDTKPAGSGLGFTALAIALAGAGGVWYTHGTLSSQIASVHTDIGSRLQALATQASELESKNSALDNRTSELEIQAGKLDSVLDETQSSLESTRQVLESATEELSQSIETGQQVLGDKIQARSEELSNALESRTSALDNLLETRSSEMANLLEAQSTEITGLVEARTSELNDSLQATQMKINRNQRAWLLSEVEYLLRTSVHRVVLAGDTNSAVEALKAAKAQLNVLSEVEYLPVERAISGEITELRSADQPDIEQLIIDIRTLSRAAGDLRMAGDDDEPKSAQATAVQTERPDQSESSSDGGIGKLASSLLNSIRQNMSIKMPSGSQYGSSGGDLFRATEEESTNAELVRLNLQAAQLAAMRRDQEGYDTHMTNARSRVLALFDPAHATTQSFISQLDLLTEISVVPRAEQLGSALRLLVETNKKIGGQS